MGEVFTKRYTAPTGTHPGYHSSFANMRLKMATILSYRGLEKILVGEQKVGKSIAGLLEQAVFLENWIDVSVLDITKKGGY